MNPDRRHEFFAAAALLALAALYICADVASMSLDYEGLVHGNIADMLAKGHGSFWKLPFFAADIEAFHDHPPLGIYLQSLLIPLVDHQHTAIRLHVLATMAAFLGALWLLVRAKPLGENPLTPYWWVVLVLFAMPTIRRVFRGNHLDGLLVTTSMMAIWFGLRAIRGGVVGPAIATALLVYVGLLIKGPVALFPLIALPWVLFIGRRSISVALAFAVIALGTVTALCFMTWLWDADARAWLEQYWTHQVRASILGERLMGDGRGRMLYHLAMNVGIGAAVALVLAFITGQYTTGQGHIRWRPEATVWMIIGLSASIPLLLSARQYDRYLMSSLPYFALAIASMVPPMRLPGTRVLQVACVVGWGLALARTTANWNAPGDHEHLLAKVRNMNELTTPDEAIVYCPGQAEPIDREVAYLYRDHGKQYGTQLNQIPTGRRFWLACDHVPEGLSERTAERVEELGRTIPLELRGSFHYVERL